MTTDLINADAIQWANDYDGELFHALICDPPYELNFMSRKWDNTGISFDPETWEAFYNILLPGAFGMAFGGSRTAHRMAVAIEDAGFIIHPQMSWIYGSGFPKATRIKENEIWEGHRYGLQALKPASEPIIVFQKPYPEKGRTIDSIIETGAGALNIDGGRIGTEGRFNTNATARVGTFNASPRSGIDYKGQEVNGRWPSNFILTHSPQCQMIGYKESDSYQINRFTDGAKPFGDGAGHEFESEEISGGMVPVWECVEGCPSQSLGDEAKFFHQSHWAIENADPFVYQAKVSQSERNSGLGYLDEITINDGREKSIDNAYQRGETKKHNPHPTLKPIALIEHLATLLLPPDEYAPRRIVVPFAGVASEMVGCWRAGWDEIVGIELEEEYAEIGRARIEYWLKQGVQLGLFGM